MTRNIILGIYLVIINILAFVLYAVDKRNAVNKLTRIPESVLLWMARLGGGLGCAVAMYALHHKKRKAKFMIRIPVWVFIWLIVVVIVLAAEDGNSVFEEFKYLWK